MLEPARQDGGVLGVIAVVLGIGFVLIGVNALTADPAKRPRPVPGAGGETRSSGSLASRRIVATAWIVVGVLFVAGAFAHLVP
ncbi:MAG TPA: hypothetical protein DCQ30_06640 [Acidimicrobiaceae bacterium]|nr:hypothetical protein [Acidimicrobiaceae bacterium]